MNSHIRVLDAEITGVLTNLWNMASHSTRPIIKELLNGKAFPWPWSGCGERGSRNPFKSGDDDGIEYVLITFGRARVDRGPNNTADLIIVLLRFVEFSCWGEENSPPHYDPQVGVVPCEKWNHKYLRKDVEEILL